MILYFYQEGELISKWEKLLQKLHNKPAEMQFEEMRKILLSHGYEERQPKGGSSHYNFRKQGSMPITIPKHNPIPAPYIKQLRKIIEEEDKKNEK